MEKYISVKDIEDAALSILPKQARDYYKSGATDEQTLADNKLAFQRYVIAVTYIFVIYLLYEVLTPVFNNRVRGFVISTRKKL